ncbi:MAG: hypothetical protein LBF26_03020 [Puniceicoccales bacterium]|jgi:hypothetical protein|nr:hypothetical protein [Puniceicoccales bacterium]
MDALIVRSVEFYWKYIKESEQIEADMLANRTISEKHLGRCRTLRRGRVDALFCFGMLRWIAEHNLVSAASVVISGIKSCLGIMTDDGCVHAEAREKGLCREFRAINAAAFAMGGEMVGAENVETAAQMYVNWLDLRHEPYPASINVIIDTGKGLICPQNPADGEPTEICGKSRTEPMRWWVNPVAGKPPSDVRRSMIVTVVKFLSDVVEPAWSEGV